MFIPLAIRHGYDQKPLAIWTLAVFVVFVNLFFLLMPGWLLEIKYSEILILAAFNRDALHGFNFLSYAFFYSQPWLFLFDLAGLLFFGTAVEARLGKARTLLIVFAAIPVAAFLHGAIYPRFDMSGMTAAVFALLGASILIYGFSEADGIALLPLPPNYTVGMTFTWAFYIMAFYTVAGLVWAALAPRDSIQITSIPGLMGGLVLGMAACALLLNGKIPVLNPKELDPSVIRRMEDQKRREEIGRQLQEDGLFVQQDDVLVEADSSAYPMQDKDDQKASEEHQRSMDIELRKQSMLKMMMLGNPADLEQAYHELIQDFPHACLASGPQLDLALALEKGFYHDSALHAYERLIQCHPHSPSAEKALLHAARLLDQIPGREAEGMRYIDRFLKTEPARHDMLEAQKILESLKGRRRASSIPDDDLVEAPPAQDAAVDKKDFAQVGELTLPSEVEFPTEFRLVDVEPAPDSTVSSSSVVYPRVRIGNKVFTPGDEALPPASKKSHGPQYTLMVIPKTEINMQVLVDVMAPIWGETSAGAMEILKKRKGLIEEHLDQDRAKSLMEECSRRGQRLLMMLESAEFQYEEVFAAEGLRFGDDALEWFAGDETIRANYDEVRMISAGLVRLDGQGEKLRAVTSVYVNEPRMIVRLRESTISSGETLKHLSLRLSEACPGARTTHAFQRAFGLEHGATPLIFECDEEFFNYNRWNLLAADAWAKIS